MRRLFPTLTQCLWSAADSDRGAQSGPVAEIVTFRLKNAADVADFATAAGKMTPFLQDTGAVLSRTLSADDNGLWTDHITWVSMEAAKSAAQQIMQEPEAGPFMSMIDEGSVTMRHAPIRFSLKLE